MTDLVTLQTWLTEAKAARHKLMIGQATASVQYEGKGQVTFTKADLNKLDAYIAQLEQQIGEAAGTATSRPGPIHFTF